MELQQVLLASSVTNGLKNEPPAYEHTQKLEQDYFNNQIGAVTGNVFF